MILHLLLELKLFIFENTRANSSSKRPGLVRLNKNRRAREEEEAGRRKHHRILPQK